MQKHLLCAGIDGPHFFQVYGVKDDGDVIGIVQKRGFRLAPFMEVNAECDGRKFKQVAFDKGGQKKLHHFAGGGDVDVTCTHARQVRDT